jgi:hypothetical protein
MSKCVGDVVREYFALRSEMLGVINSSGTADDGHPGLVHSLVARMEERIGTRADARADELAEGQRRLECMFDRFVILYLVHTWEVPPELHASAIASANQRYGNYCRAVEDLLSWKGRDDAADQSPEAADAASS